MKGTALTAFLPNLTGFTSPRGLRSSRVQQVASRASSCIGEREGARRQSDRRTPSSTRCRASTERVPGEYRAGARLVPGECPAVLDPRCPVSARPATAPAATATATARGGRSPARRGGPAAAPRVTATVTRPPATVAAAATAAGRTAPRGRPAQLRKEVHRDDAQEHNEDEPHVRHLSHTPVFPGSGIPASRVKGKCPRAARPKAHLRKSRGCPQDDDHEHTREQ